MYDSLSSHPSFVSYIVFMLLCLVGMTTGTIYTITSFGETIGSISFILLLCSFLINICLGLYVLRTSTSNSPSPFISSLRSCHLKISCLLLGFWLFIRCYGGDCENMNGSQFVSIWSCNPQSNSETLPVDTMIMLMMSPLIYTSIFKNTLSWVEIVTSWIITVSWLIICIAIFHAYNSIFALVFYAPVSFILLYQNTFYKVDIVEKEILQIKNDAEFTIKQQQSMVSNVAHDLKTVSKLKTEYSYIY